VTKYGLLGLTVIALAMLYLPVLIGLMEDWYKDGNDAHGMFVPLVSAYLIWSKRHIIMQVTCQPAALGLLLVAFSLGLLFLGTLGAELFLARVSLVLILAGLIVNLRGWETLNAVRFPIAFLFLMIPLPGLIYYQLVLPLQLFASRLVTFGLETLNLFPIVREGNLLILPHHTLEVVEACSGVRSLMSLFTLAVGYGYFVQANKSIRSILILLVPPLAIFSNAFRVFLEALVVHYRDVDLAEGTYHMAMGVITFVVAALLLLASERVCDGIFHIARLGTRNNQPQSANV
jgi:exosortase